MRGSVRGGGVSGRRRSCGVERGTVGSYRGGGVLVLGRALEMEGRAHGGGMSARLRAGGSDARCRYRGTASRDFRARVSRIRGAPVKEAARGRASRRIRRLLGVHRCGRLNRGCRRASGGVRSLPGIGLRGGWPRRGLAGASRRGCGRVGARVVSRAGSVSARRCWSLRAAFWARCGIGRLAGQMLGVRALSGSWELLGWAALAAPGGISHGLGRSCGGAGEGCERGGRAATRPVHRTAAQVDAAPAPCAGRDGEGRRDGRRARAKKVDGARLSAAQRAAWSPQRARTVRCARSRGARRGAEPAAARGGPQSAGAAFGPADPRSDARAGLARRGPR